MPAVLSAIFSAIYAAAASKDTYGNQLVEIFPAMKQVGNKTEGLEYVIGVSFQKSIKLSLLLMDINF